MKQLETNTFVITLQQVFEQHANEAVALQQKEYMRNKFEFFGLKTDKRRDIQKPFLVKEYLPAKEYVFEIVQMLYSKPQREFHHFAQELVFKYTKQFVVDDIQLLEFMIINNSWWDTVDFIAVKLVGDYFKTYPEQRDGCIARWFETDNIWLHRTALIFQLKYKDKFDFDFAKHVINKLLGSKEFFINKAIGWLLREYSRTNSEAVIEFVNSTNLSGLSKREAVRLIK